MTRRPDATFRFVMMKPSLLPGRLLCPRVSSNWRQSLHLVRNSPARRDQVRYEALADVEGPFVLAPVPHVVTLRQHSLVTLRQHSPDIRPGAESVGQYLKDDDRFDGR
jgi:hypothetical protein